MARCSSDRRFEHAKPEDGDEGDDDSEQQGLPEQPAQIGAERRLPARDLGALRVEIGIVQLLDFLRDVENRLSPRHDLLSEKAGASKNLFGGRPVEQRLERLPVVVELCLESAECVRHAARSSRRSSASGRDIRLDGTRPAVRDTPARARATTSRR